MLFELEITLSVLCSLCLSLSCFVLLVAQLTWKSDSLQQLEEERANWEVLKAEAIKSVVEQEHKRWRETGLLSEL